MVGKFMAKVIAEIQDWADVKLRISGWWLSL